MRVVIDTNVLVSALWKPDSDPGRIVLLALEGGVELYAPDTVRAELERVLRGKLEYSESEWVAALEALPVEWVKREEYEEFLDVAHAAIRDRSDAPIVATAILIRAAIVTGDHDFHPLRGSPVEILWPRDFTGPGRGRRGGGRRKGIRVRKRRRRPSRPG